MLLSLGVPCLGQASQLALLSAPTVAQASEEASRGGGGAWPAVGSKPGVLRIPTAARSAQASRAGVQSQDGVACTAAARVAGDWAKAGGARDRTASHGASASGHPESAVGLGHHGYPSLGWTEGALGHYDRLRRSDGVGLALCPSHHGRGSGRDAAGSGVPPVRRSAQPSPGDRVPQRQWAGVHLAPLPSSRSSDGVDSVPYTSPQSAIERAGGGVFRELQERLRLS